MASYNIKVIIYSVKVLISVGHILVQGKAKQPLMTSYNIKLITYNVTVLVSVGHSLFRAKAKQPLTTNYKIHKIYVLGRTFKSRNYSGNATTWSLSPGVTVGKPT